MRAVRRELIRCAVASGISRFARTLRGRRHVILTFHRVRPNGEPLDPFDTCPSVTVSVFRNVLEYVASRFDVVPLSDLTQRGPGDRPAAAITFDDGWRDNFDLAFPVLRQLNLPATIFVTTGKIGASQPFWQQELGRLFREAKPTLAHRDYRTTVQQWKMLTEGERGERLRDLGCGAGEERLWSPVGRPFQADQDGLERPSYEERCFLSADEIREMAGSGIEFGSHTVNHAILTQLSPNALRAELAESKTALESIIGRAVDTLAYPNGDCSDVVVRCAQETGYRIGCTTRSARVASTDHPLRLPRVEPEWDFPSSDCPFDETMFQWRVR
jgi:peptidoglycan/xylan/chitin deacetylase (PgdA/CDA1 family)